MASMHQGQKYTSLNFIRGLCRICPMAQNASLKKDYFWHLPSIPTIRAFIIRAEALKF
jgi:hypothetical protein